MGGCPCGAVHKPGDEGIRVWLNADTLEAAIQTFLGVYLPWWSNLIVPWIVDIKDLCESNPDPPEPFDIKLLVTQNWPTTLAGSTPFPAVTDWIYRWITYQTFLLRCDCLPCPPDPIGNCIPGMAAPVTLPGGGVQEFPPLNVSADIVASWTLVDRVWSFYRQGIFSCVTGPQGNCLGMRMQVFSDGTWRNVDDLMELVDLPDTCFLQVTQAVIDTLPTSPVRLRVINTDSFPHQMQLSKWCFCAPTAAPMPLPPFVPPTGVSPPPARLCNDQLLCDLVQELGRRLTVLSTQVSDLQARLGGSDQLEVISSTSIAGEGEVVLPLGTRAVSIDLQTLGSGAYTSALGRPRGLMRVGSVRWGDGHGYSARQFIDGDRWDAVRPPNTLSLSFQLLEGTTGLLIFLR